MRIAFSTLGCKINQYESDLLRQDLLSRGNTIVPFDDDADIYIINTCSVTQKSDYQCRQVIRSAVKRGQGAKVVVTGCYASTRPEEIQAIDGVGLVVHNKDKSGIADKVLNESAPDYSSPLVQPLQAIPGRTRSFLKIQDGCDNRCSYCIVPSARGASRSANPEAVIQEFERLVESGCPEIVLTGIHIGLYGSDLEGVTLTSLTEALMRRQGPARIRLSSIEANEITPELIGFLGRGICRHLHIPLQSGDDTVLVNMKRRYTSGDYLGLLQRIAKEVPGMALGADVIVGFPGEGEKEFRNTLNLIQESPLTHLHIFSYSKRPGTEAAEMSGQVPDNIKKTRNAALRALGEEKNLEFRKSLLGHELRVVLEDKVNPNSRLLSGLTDNYIRVGVLGAEKGHIGRELRIRLEKANKEENIGSIL